MTISPTKTRLRPGWRFALSHPCHLLATGFLSGLAPVAPGTFGTLAAFPLWWLLTLLPAPSLVPLLLLFTVGGVAICGYTARVAGSADPGFVVWDEIAAFFWVLLLCPANFLAQAAAFGLFRLFDAAKPWPIRWLDRHIEGGLGIMLDDLAAALCSVLVLRGLTLLWPVLAG